MRKFDGNSDSAEARRMRENSKFLKHVEDFLTYTAEEYVCDDDNKCMMIMAADKGISPHDGKDGVVASVIGNGGVMCGTVASLLERPEFPLRKILDIVGYSGDDDDDDDDDPLKEMTDYRAELLAERRRHIIFLVALVLWLCGNVALSLWLGFVWWAVLPHVALIGFVTYMVIGAYREACREIADVQNDITEYFKDQVHRAGDNMMNIMQMMKKMKKGEEEEDEE